MEMLDLTGREPILQKKQKTVRKNKEKAAGRRWNLLLNVNKIPESESY